MVAIPITKSDGERARSGVTTQRFNQLATSTTQRSITNLTEVVEFKFKMLLLLLIMHVQNGHEFEIV